MNIRQLEIFVQVAAAGSVTQAADQLFISQPAVSKALRELETAIGTPLFDRIDNRLHLNPAGQAFCIRAKRLLAEYQALANFGREAAQALPLRVGTSLTLGQISLPAAITRFKAQYPHTPLTLYAENVQQIKDRLIRGDIDVAFIEGFASSRSFHAEPISDYPLLIVGRPGLIQGPLTVDQLAVVPFLLREKGSTLRDRFADAVHRLGADVVPILQSSSTAVLINAAVAGLGLTILPVPFAQPYVQAGTLAVYELPGVAMKTVNYAITLRDAAVSPAQRAMVACFLDAESENQRKLTPGK